MVSHVTAVLLITVAAAIVSLISPEGEMKKYVKFVASIAVLASIAVPIVASITKLPDAISEIKADGVGNIQAEFDLISASSEKIEQSIVQMISNEFIIDSEKVSAHLTLDSSDTAAIKILRVSVFVPPGTDTESVRSYVIKLMKNTCDVDVTEVYQ